MVHRTRRLERGAAAVEMALLLPVLVLFVGGIVDFGRAFFTQVVLTNAAREGARAAIVLTTGTPNADIQIRAQAASLDVSGTVTVTIVKNCVAALPTDQAQVQVSAPFTYTFLGIIPGIQKSTTLTSKAVMACQ